MSTVQVEPVLGNLSRSLGELWQAAEREHDDDELLTRALTQTLILVTDTAHVEEMQELVDGLPSRHPCRVVFVVLGDDPTTMRAELVGRIRERGSTRAMVLEKLTLTTDWTQYRKLPNLIRPLLVNDIPTSLFWAMRLPDSVETVAALAGMADRTLFDSSLFDGDHWRGLRRLRAHCPIDLAWLRVAPWRRALAEAFEHFEWHPVDPETSVVIEHGATSGALGAARCLEHWLIGKLGAITALQRVDDAAAGAPENEPLRIALQHGPVHVTLQHQDPAEHRCPGPRIRTDVTLDDHCLMPSFVTASRGTRCSLLSAALDTRVSMSC